VINLRAPSYLAVHHVTVYRYSEPVGLGEHRMMFRPRESHDLRLRSAQIEISPQPTSVRWVHDVFDNSIAVVNFDAQTEELRFETTVTLEHFETKLPEFPLEDYATHFPFRYSREDRAQLEQALTQHYSTEGVSEWAGKFAREFEGQETLALLRAMTLCIKKDFKYVRRSRKGVQDPGETLKSRSGSCRDYAVLMMESARSIGLAARFVSGYIFVPKSQAEAVLGAGATHAWVQIYLPGAGWVDFDPTNDIVGNRNLIRVAFAWDHRHVLPLWGTFYGEAAAFVGMDVTVQVTEDVFEGLDVPI
jgi:transglutaminase-like putative cysteine protease